MIVLIAAAAIVAAAAYTERPQQFDLKCAGTSHVDGDLAGEHLKGNTPATTTLHIDLAKKVFCQDECRYVRGVAWFSSTEITLRDDKAKARSELFHIDRVSGGAVWSIKDPTTSVLTFLTCEAAPFSGLELRETPKF